MKAQSLFGKLFLGKKLEPTSVVVGHASSLADGNICGPECQE